MPTQPHPEIGRDTSREQQHDVLPRLLHEVRQPLCGIESIAYYLEMALEDHDDVIHQQCGKLRAMVRQASWLLDDAALGAPIHESGPHLAYPNDVVQDIAERLALHDERPLDLHLPGHSPRVKLGEARLRRFLEHVLCFFHEVAEVAEPVRIWARQEESLYALCLSGRVAPERRRELESLFESLRPDGLAGALSSIGGALEIASPGDCLEVSLLFPTAPHD